MCGGSDALARYSDGSAHCFAGCNHRESANGEVVSIAKKTVEFNVPLAILSVECSLHAPSWRYCGV